MWLWFLFLSARSHSLKGIPMWKAWLKRKDEIMWQDVDGEAIGRSLQRVVMARHGINVYLVYTNPHYLPKTQHPLRAA